MVCNKVTATVSTRGRTNTTLPLMLSALASQTLLPCRLIIYDDNDTLVDLRENEIYLNLFRLMDQKGIKWEVVVGSRKGQVRNHQRALTDVKTDWIWRLDDDNIMEPNTLKDLFEYAITDSKIAAVGPLILDPKTSMSHKLASNKIEDIFLGLNIQWCNTGLQSFVDVDHLQGSTFLFRRDKAGLYDMSLSKVGHREETMFTYQMKRNGFRLVVLTSVKTWHMRYGAGGIRSHTNAEFYKQDEEVFRRFLEVNKVIPNRYKIIPLDSGIGDHFAFRSILPQIKEANKGARIIIGACYPEAFKDEEGVEIISLDECRAFVNIEDYNIYAWMDKHNWTAHVSAAYAEMHK